MTTSYVLHDGALYTMLDSKSILSYKFTLLRATMDEYRFMRMKLPNVSIVLLFFSCLGACYASSRHQYEFKRNQVSFGFYEKHVLPRFLPHPPSPIFWSSKSRVDYGLLFTYERTVFHTQKYFSINVGANFAWWSDKSQIQLALAGYFVFRFWLFRTQTFNPYIEWSIAGPSIISRRFFNNHNLGSRFIFQDFLGIGAVVGRAQHIVISFKMVHYSNGDLFMHNDGFNVPIVLSIGFVFN